MAPLVLLRGYSGTSPSTSPALRWSTVSPRFTMSECGCSLLPIGRQDAPGVAYAHSHEDCRLIQANMLCQQAVEDLKSCLLLLRQRQRLHSRTFSLATYSGQNR